MDGTGTQQGQPGSGAGWYADPYGAGGTRWWDGTAWTLHYQPPPPTAALPPSPVGTQSSTSLFSTVGQEQPPPPGPFEQPSDTPWATSTTWATVAADRSRLQQIFTRRNAYIGTGILMGLTLLVAVASIEPEPKVELEASTADLGENHQELVDLQGLLDSENETTSLAPSSTTSTTQAPETTLPASTETTNTTSAPTTISPSTVASTIEAITSAPSTTQIPKTTVTSTTQAPTTQAPTSQPPTTPAQSGCDPNYSGCVPIDSDVDCAGGSGNGPSYAQGPIKVLGSDIYGLDRDNDGIACE